MKFSGCYECSECGALIGFVKEQDEPWTFQCLKCFTKYEIPLNDLKMTRQSQLW